MRGQKLASEDRHPGIVEPAVAAPFDRVEGNWHAGFLQGRFEQDALVMRNQRVGITVAYQEMEARCW